MSTFDDRAAFADRLREIIANFRDNEQLIRDEYARSEGSSPPPAEILERPTRRFLIDEFLRALDWEPGDPASVLEEARLQGPSDNWLFLDYLGMDPKSHTPVLIFEAKKLGIEPPRAPHGKLLGSRDMSVVIAEAIDALRVGSTKSPVLAVWVEFLGDMYRYMKSLDEIGRVTLQRAVISAGRWMIIFEDPCGTFLGNKNDSGKIHCFTTFDEALAGSDDLFDLLHRQQLVDTLSLTLDVQEAVRVIPPDKIEQWFRANVVATSSNNGSFRRKYPTRAVYPALVVRSGGRWFAIVNLNRLVEEPKRKNDISGFLGDLEAAGLQLEEQLGRLFGIPIAPLPLGDFSGFPEARRTIDPLRAPVEPAPRSTAGRMVNVPARKIFAARSHHADATREFVVVVGSSRFYKTGGPWGPLCGYHCWRDARADAASEESSHEGFTADSFTEDGQDRHCAHAGMLGLRAERCRIKSLETHLCCRACVFEPECWADIDDQARLPCPPRS